MPAAKYNRKGGHRSPTMYAIGLHESSFPVSSRRMSTFSVNNGDGGGGSRDAAVREDDNQASSDHRLTSFERGESDVEEVVLKIEDRKAERITVTSDVHQRFLKKCMNIAKDNAYPQQNKIRLSDLIDFRDEIMDETQNTENMTHWIKDCWMFAGKCFGFRSHSEQLCDCLNKAVDVVKKQESNDMGWFHFMDFHIYYMRIESRWPWMRSKITMSLIAIFIFYLFTPIFFCYIVRDSGVCPSDPNGKNVYHGWMTALYFASATLSTVGYGDVHVEQSSDWNLLAGVLYMILSNIVLIVAFSAAADSSLTVFSGINDRLLSWVWGQNEDELLSAKVRRVAFMRIGQTACTFTLLNMIGVIASRVFVLDADESGEDWSWMTSLYWAVQTTTTIGYGDLQMSFDGIRWFQIFYLILSTYFVGNTLGGLASLKEEIHEIHEYAAWNQRELSKGLIDEFQSYDHDGKIDQYEFVVASLVVLGKVSYSDVVPIMDKFRSLANDDGFVSIEEDISPSTLDDV